MEAGADKESAKENSATKENREVETERERGIIDKKMVNNLNGLRNQGCFEGL